MKAKKCKYCPERFDTMRELRIHFRGIHPRAGRQLDKNLKQFDRENPEARSKECPICPHRGSHGH